jgi:hypothetical protein
MNKAILLSVLNLLLLTYISQAQGKKELSYVEKKKMVLFLISRHELVAEDSSWHEYLDAIFYKQIFNNVKANGDEIYIFSTKSTHASYFLLLKQGSVFKILDNSSLNDNIKALLIFFRSNTNIGSKKLLETISKIIETYQYNQDNSQKIPLTGSGL